MKELEGLERLIKEYLDLGGSIINNPLTFASNSINLVGYNSIATFKEALINNITKIKEKNRKEEEKREMDKYIEDIVKKYI